MTTRESASLDLDLDADLVALFDRRGELIGDRYLLDDVLGVGGMGVVYAAAQPALARPVAIKVPRPEIADDAVVRSRLAFEAYVVSRINHRNVIRLLDVGVHRGVPYFVMDRVDGPRLGKLVRSRGPLEPWLAARFAIQILAALEEVHATNVVHADVKSDNLLVETLRDGSSVLRLIDFGLARFVDAPEEPGPQPVISGTPAYLAPELIAGELPSFASDLYAVGIIFYELVTARTPFEAPTNLETLGRHVASDLIPMTSRCGRAVPVGYEKVARCALAKRPDERFDSARAFRLALEEVVAATAMHDQSWDEDVTPPLAAVPLDPPPPVALNARRIALTAAIERKDPEGCVLAYLELARAFVDDNRLERAIAALEAGVELLTRPGPLHSSSVWRLQLTLTALRDQSSDRATSHRVNDEAPTLNWTRR